MKALLGIIVILAVVGGVGFGLKKMGKLPGAKKPVAAAAPAGTAAKGGKPGALIATANPPVDNDPLAQEKRTLAAQRKALDDEKAAFQTQKNAANGSAVQAAKTAMDPKSLMRMASVYEQMSPDVVARIFAKLPDDQVLALLRRMEEKRVGETLASFTPERAAKFTQELSHPAPAE